MREDWQRFISGCDSTPKVEPVIYRSWIRSRDYRLNFERIIDNNLLPSGELQQRREVQEPLLRSVYHVLPHIAQIFRNFHYMVILCDPDGYILDAVGDPSFMNRAQKVNLSPGACWREDIKGTNAIGTALAEKMPISVLGSGHFVAENHFLNCWAAPIFGRSGEVIGILDISGDVTQRTHPMLELAIMGATMIEQNFHLLQLRQDFRLERESAHLAGSLLSQGAIRTDSQGILTAVSRSATQKIGRRQEEIIGQPLKEALAPIKSPVSGTLGQAKPSFSTGNPVHPPNFPQELAFITAPVLDSTHDIAVQLPWLGRSLLTREAFAKAAKAANSNSSVLIQGESGVGKEVIAHYIHQLSPRRHEPFVALSCATLAPSLIQSELFGYVDGAFTGAKKGGQPGKFELADGGTLFLDEIGDISSDLQVLLLRVFQEREVVRIGDSKSRKLNVRIITATHQNLASMVETSRFRLDLYYRLKVVSITMPPLRERLEDIWDLVPHFVRKACQTLGKPQFSVAGEVYAHLFNHHWPGNIRELENCIESMVALADGPLLTVDDLPTDFIESARPFNFQEPLLPQLTRQAILQALSQTKGKIAPAARLLGIGRSTLYRKLAELNISL
ncbi:MAG: sigma-54-dependent Fis family transcriptional regulator [Desulfitobacteriaceae bacterium]